MFLHQIRDVESLQSLHFFSVYMLFWGFVQPSDCAAPISLLFGRRFPHACIYVHRCIVFRFGILPQFLYQSNVHYPSVQTDFYYALHLLSIFYAFHTRSTKLNCKLPILNSFPLAGEFSLCMCENTPFLDTTTGDVSSTGGQPPVLFQKPNTTALLATAKLPGVLEGCSDDRLEQT